MDRLNALAGAAYKTAKSLIEEKEQEPILPVFLMLDKNDKVHIFGTPYSGDEEKDATAKFIREEAKRIDAKAYIHVAEAWVTTVSKGDNWRDMPRPSVSESRREVVIVAGEDTDGKIISRMWEIHRDPLDPNKRSLGPEEKSLRDSKTLEGRFANLLSE